MLKCPICGKNYAYESKICRQCENDAIRSGLVKEDPSINNLLVFNSYCWLGKIEHHELRIEQPPLYDWNCNVKAKVHFFPEIQPNFMNIVEIPLDGKVYPSLYFE